MNYVSVTDEQRACMLLTCGVSSIQELFDDVPRYSASLSMSNEFENFFDTDGLSELELFAQCERLAALNNTRFVSFLGGGFYDHFIPAAVDAIVSRSEFYTAYTPYQPELSQGTLQAIYEYQSHICRLTGMEISNASLYDGGTAIFEACKMAISQTSKNKIVVDCGVNPIYRNMLKTHTDGLGVEIVEIPVLRDGTANRRVINESIDDTVAAVVLQNPNFLGIIDDHSDIALKCKSLGAIAIQSVYPVALAILKSPAEQGFDIAIGEGQSLGLPLSFGGPYLGFIGAKIELARKMPGRIAALTSDANGNAGFVLTLQAREQHIRREKATSNICSNEALCALRAHIHLSLLGSSGLTEAAALCHSKATYLRERVKSIKSVKCANSSIFNEFFVELPIDADTCVERMFERGFAAGIPVGKYHRKNSYKLFDDDYNADNLLLMAVTEKRTKAEIDDFVECLGSVLCL